MQRLRKLGVELPLRHSGIQGSRGYWDAGSVPRRHSGLRIRCGHSCDVRQLPLRLGSNPWPGNSICCGGAKKKKKNKTSGWGWGEERLPRLRSKIWVVGREGAGYLPESGRGRGVAAALGLGRGAGLACEGHPKPRGRFSRFCGKFASLKRPLSVLASCFAPSVSFSLSAPTPTASAFCGPVFSLFSL